MTSAPSLPVRRVAFLGRAQFELAVPTSCTWAQAEYVPFRTSWQAAVEEAVQLDPAVSVFFDPRGLAPGDLARLSGLRIGIATDVLNADELAQLKSLCSNPSTGFRWVTLFEPPRETVEGLPVLQMLPGVIDTARLPGLQLDASGAAVPEWALPPSPGLENVRALPQGESPLGLVAALAGSGILLYRELSERLGRDPLPLLALALGLLVISDAEFPPRWGIEPEDEYLVRPIDEWNKTLRVVRQAPHSFNPVRIRAWQKAREMFDASLIFKRLIHDAFLFQEPAMLHDWTQLASASTVNSRSARGAGR